MRKYFLPSLLFILMVVALVTLKSIAPELLNKQVLAYFLGFLLFVSISQVNFNYFWKISPYLYWAINLVLFVLLLIGRVNRGIVAWIQLPFGLRFQPSQIAVALTALFLAKNFKDSGQRQQQQVLSWQLLLKLLFLIILPAVLIILEPDFGTAAVFLVASAVFFIFNRLSWQQVLSFLSAIVISLVFLWSFVLADYQKARLSNFLLIGHSSQAISSDYRQESSAAYNARQALIAIGAGQFWGQGLGQGSQSHLKFLPERQTDFIFASFVEEWGFLGSILILSLYFMLLLFILYLTHLENNRGKQLYLLAVFMMLLVQIFINIGMNLALLPITGITLPFLSYGGSSILSFFLTLALVQRILLEQEKRASSIFQ